MNTDSDFLTKNNAIYLIPRFPKYHAQRKKDRKNKRQKVKSQTSIAKLRGIGRETIRV